jgi:hypothetical protein
MFFCFLKQKSTSSSKTLIWKHEANSSFSILLLFREMFRTSLFGGTFRKTDAKQVKNFAKSPLLLLVSLLCGTANTVLSKTLNVSKELLLRESITRPSVFQRSLKDSIQSKRNQTDRFESASVTKFSKCLKNTRSSLKIIVTSFS